MIEKKLLPAEADPRNPSFAYKNIQNEHVENTNIFNRLQFKPNSHFRLVYFKLTSAPNHFLLTNPLLSFPIQSRRALSK